MPIRVESHPRRLDDQTASTAQPVACGSFKKIDAEGSVVHTHSTTDSDGTTVDYRGTYYFDEKVLSEVTTFTTPSGESSTDTSHVTFHAAANGTADEQAAFAAACACSHMDVGTVYTPATDAPVVAAGTFEKTNNSTVRHISSHMDGETEIRSTATYDFACKEVENIVRKISPSGEVDGFTARKTFTQMFNGTLEQQAALRAAQKCAALSVGDIYTPSEESAAAEPPAATSTAVQATPQATTLRVPKLNFKAG